MFVICGKQMITLQNNDNCKQKKTHKKKITKINGILWLARGRDKKIYKNKKKMK